jgi:hypothetical protein
LQDRVIVALQGCVIVGA